MSDNPLPHHRAPNVQERIAAIIWVCGERDRTTCDVIAEMVMDMLAEELHVPIMPKVGKPVDEAYIHAYGIGYYYGREHGDDELGIHELVERYGRSDDSNISEYVGFRAGYADGVNDYMEHDCGELVSGRETPSPENAWGG